MPTHSIVFNLPVEASELQSAMKGRDYYCVLNDLRENIRKKLNYGDLSKSELETYEQVRTLFFELCKERDVNV